MKKHNPNWGGKRKGAGRKPAAVTLRDGQVVSLYTSEHTFVPLTVRINQRGEFALEPYMNESGQHYKVVTG